MIAHGLLRLPSKGKKTPPLGGRSNVSIHHCTKTVIVMNMKFTGHVKTAPRSSHTKNRVCRGCSAPYRTFKNQPPHPVSRIFMKLGSHVYTVPDLQKSLLDPYPKTHRKSDIFIFLFCRFFNFRLIFEQTPPRELSLGLHIFVVCSEDGT